MIQGNAIGQQEKVASIVKGVGATFVRDVLPKGLQLVTMLRRPARLIDCNVLGLTDRVPAISPAG